MELLNKVKQGIWNGALYIKRNILNLIGHLCIVPIHVYMGFLAGPVREQKYKKFYIFER